MQPLSGVLVLELGDLRSGYCGRLLADLGARVIKLETSLATAQQPVSPRLVRPDGHTLSLVHEYYHANKERLVCNPRAPAGSQLLNQWLAHADILLLGHDLPDLQALGVAPEKVAEAFPHLIITTITGFGLTGPKRSWRVTDLIAFASGGLMSISGPPELPVRAPGQQAYDTAGVHASLATLIALWECRASGRGQVVDLSIQECLAGEEYLISRYSEDGQNFRREGSQHQVAAPGCVYPCLDGFVYLMVSPTRPDDWNRYCKWIGNPPELVGPEWSDGAYRRQNRALIDRVTRRFMANRTRNEISAEGQALRLPCTPVHTPGDFLTHPQTQARDYLVPLQHPLLGEVLMPGPPFKLTTTPWHLRKAAPQADEPEATLPDPSRSFPAPTSPTPDRSQPGGKVGPGCSADALQGVRILDLSHMIAGPYATLLLSHFGAEVIKVESERRMDGFRMREGSGINASRPFAEFNRNKFGITLDLKTAEGLALARDLVARCDVVVENFSSGVMERLGLGYEVLKAIRPGVIQVTMPGLGNSGPCRDWVTWGPNIQHWTGISDLWTPPDSPEPVGTQTAHADYLAGIHAAFAVMAVLHHRAKTGQGQSIEVSQAECSAALLGPAYLEELWAGRTPQRHGNADPDLAPHGVYRASGIDRWVALCARTESEWLRLCTVAGREWERDPRFASRAERLFQRAELDAAITDWTRHHDAHWVAETLQAAGVPASAVMTGADLFHDAHLAERGFLVKVQHPAMPTLSFPGIPLRLSRTPGRDRHHAPLLGQHTLWVLQNVLQLDPSQVEELQRVRAIR